MVPGELLTTKEAANYLGMPESTLRWWRYIGTGPASFNRTPFREVQALRPGRVGRGSICPDRARRGRAVAGPKAEVHGLAGPWATPGTARSSAVERAPCLERFYSESTPVGLTQGELSKWLIHFTARGTRS